MQGKYSKKDIHFNGLLTINESNEIMKIFRGNNHKNASGPQLK